MEIIDIVNKLIGPIASAADSAIDSQRLANLKEYCDLAAQMILNIRAVSRESNSQFDSVKKMGEYAKKFLNEAKEDYL